VTDSASVTGQQHIIHPSAHALGDAILITQGAYAPLDRFVCAEEGRRIRDRGQLVDGAAFPVPVTLLVDHTEAHDMTEGDTVVLVDAEGAAVAEVRVDSLWVAGGSHVGVGGPVRALDAPEHSFASLARPAREVRDQSVASGTRGVLLDRPLLAAEVSALAEIAEDGPVALLVRSVDPTVPADVLTRATLAAAAAVPGAQVLTVPFAPRHDRADDGARST
jgi:sulfate adenylyltransferase